jgi:hypothetical protein
MEIPTLIYCGGGNRTFAEIAISAGFKYGVRLPGTAYAPIYFADQDWKHPNRAAYMTALAKHTPFMASVLDWERQEQLPEVLSWAEEAAQFCEVVVIIPKVHGGVSQLPRSIGGKQIRLGYSVPTKHGGTSLMISEFYGWPVHLLGGSPHEQVYIWRYLPGVVSADGNMAMKMATMFCAYYDYNYRNGKRTHWPTISGVDGHKWTGDNAPAEALRRSLTNIKQLWLSVTQSNTART